MSNPGALFDDAAAPSPTAAIFPPAMPISTSRPSASRQLVRNASTSVMGRSSRTAFPLRHATLIEVHPVGSPVQPTRREEGVISAPVPGVDPRREYGHHQSPAIRAS
jgi:hypothetical protein